jgi:hypothetical protein
MKKQDVKLCKSAAFFIFSSRVAVYLDPTQSKPHHPIHNLASGYKKLIEACMNAQRRRRTEIVLYQSSHIAAC